MCGMMRFFTFDKSMLMCVCVCNVFAAVSLVISNCPRS